MRQPRERVFGERRDGADFRYVSTSALHDRIAAIAYALRAFGIERGDRVALVSHNRIDWIVADFGILAAGCVCVPLFATLAADQLEFILRDCSPKLVFVETAQDARRVAQAAPLGTPIVQFEGEGAGTLAEFESRGAALYAAEPGRFGEFHDSIKPDDLAVLIYTSGTTGDPKGVMLSHDNIASNAASAWSYGLQGIPSDGVGLSVLPYAHIMEHTNLIGYVYSRLTCIVSVPDRLVADLHDIRPHVMSVVPRLLERVLNGILTRSREAGGLRAYLVPWALRTGRIFAAARADGRPSFLLRLRYAAAWLVVLRKLRPLLGLDRLVYFVCGSAPLHRDVAYTFAGAGVVICEGYGQTETSPVISVNRVVDNRYGTVGKPIPGVSVRIAEDGEILVRGPNVMKGYYHHDPSVFTSDGWLLTGDIGELDADGYLRITDRKRELIKTSGGKFIAPARVETAIKRSLYVSQVMLVGEGRPYPAAVLVPHWTLLREQLRIAEELPWPLLATRADVREFMQSEVAEQTKDLASYEQVRRVAILPRDLTIEDGELSPTMKVMRRVVEQRYADLIESAYR
ncbi:MAG TPA: long-chain fatty acid--CoA ligase [Candidatus Acidoferrales bacterium]|nr:long-chain fatty acid--CoA ligase [Candidatus Acidoferrales bacterium]